MALLGEGESICLKIKGLPSMEVPFFCLIMKKTLKLDCGCLLNAWDGQNGKMLQRWLFIGMTAARREVAHAIPVTDLAKDFLLAFSKISIDKSTHLNILA